MLQRIWWCWMATSLFMMVFIASELVKDENIMNLLTETEWKNLIGNEDKNSFTVTYIKKLPLNLSQHQLEIEAPKFGQSFNLHLSQSPQLTSGDFVVLETYNNESIPMEFNQEDFNCYFRGNNSALSLCNGVNGILHSGTDYFYSIKPLPYRLHNNFSIPHLLVKKARNLFIKDYYNFYPSNIHFPSSKNNYTKEFKTKLNNKQEIQVGKLKRNKREILPSGKTVFVETAVFVDKDLFELMKMNFPLDTEREIIRFVLAMINAVQLLYHDPSLGRPVNFVLKRLDIMKEEIPDLVRSPDIDQFLSNFCKWQRNKNIGNDWNPLHWDHALILTGLDLYVRGKHGKISNQVVGLAPVAGMCMPTSSCTVNEGRHFESVYVVAHEIGHNLGMRHDGAVADNDCDPTSYIMSPTLGSGKITWSACSKRYLQKFLETPQSYCLLDHGSSAGQLDHGADEALPGERFNADQQCMLKYGRESKHSSRQPLDDVCRDLHCEKERYTWTSHPALEGTWCGQNMWCRGGKCTSKGNIAKKFKQNPELDQLKGEWSDWRQAECASGCLFGEEGRLRSGSTGIVIMERFCNNPNLQNKLNGCEGPVRKYQTCNAQQCLNVARLTIKEFADQLCTRAKEVDKELTGSGMQLVSSDPNDACVVWCQKRNGENKTRRWSFPDGTACQTRRNKFGISSYCISGRCEDFVCNGVEEAIFTQMPDLCPVERDTNDINNNYWRTGLKRRDIAIRWKSASGCRYNCIAPGSGIRLVIDKKQSKSSIQLCPAEQSGCNKVKSPFQHASIICSKYKYRVSRLSGLGMQISASLEDPNRPCRVACQDENLSYRFYLVNGEDGWFPFGTDCSKGSTDKKAFCIEGKCLSFGEDDTPLSESEFTLPLLSRIKRSLDKIRSKVTVKLKQEELDAIVDRFNRTLSGFLQPALKIFDIDYNNPIHLHKDAATNPYDPDSTDGDIINYT